jgi:hypothetical protein
MITVKDINKSTYCDECQGPLALTNKQYNPTKLYTRIHSIDCSNMTDQPIGGNI